MSAAHDTTWLALDIGAKSHTWVRETNGQRETGKVDNTSTELRTLLKACITRGTCLRVLVEATGVYYLDVAMLAHELGAEVMVVNPRVAHHFAKAPTSATRPTSWTRRCCWSVCNACRSGPGSRPG